MKVRSHLNVKKSLARLNPLHDYKNDVKKNLLFEYPDAVNITVTSVGKKADDMNGADYWHLTATGEVE